MDLHDINHISDQLESARAELSAMADVVGKARQIKEWASERRKVALAKHAAPLLSKMAVSAAEHVARASQPYLDLIKILQRELTEAEQTIAKYDAIKCKWESARSIMSMQRTIAGI